MTRPAQSYTATRGVVVQASLNLSIGTSKGKYQQGRGYTL